MNINALSSNAPLSKPNRFKYNGKEEQTDFDLNWYHFDTRMHDPQLGRFLSIDLLSDKYSSQSTYVYAANNPIRYVDFMGMGPGDVSQYERNVQETSVATVEVDGKKVTQITSHTETTTANDFELTTKYGPVPKGLITKTTSTTTVHVNGDGEIIGTTFSQSSQSNEELGGDNFKEISSQGGTVDIANGTVELDDGTIKDLAPNLSSDVGKIANFNRDNDIDFPRAAAQDFLDGSNSALNLVGLVPQGKGIMGVLSFLGSNALPEASDIASDGFSIQESWWGNVGVVGVGDPPTVHRKMKSGLIK